MQQFSQSELYDVVNQYLASEDEQLAALRTSVVEWRLAKDVMFSLHPLFPEVDRQTSGKWKVANRRWLKKEPASLFYRHGIDADGQIRLIEQSHGIVTAMHYHDGLVDEMTFGGRATSLVRTVVDSDRTVAIYKYVLDPHQYSCETFEYENGKCVRSRIDGWYESGGQWEESMPKVYSMQYDRAGLLEVSTETIGSVFGPEIVFRRPPSKAKESPLKQQTRRRRFFAYTVSLSPNSKDHEYEVQSDAYGLEMTYDDEWPIQTVHFTPPHLTSVVTENTGLPGQGVELGSSGMPMSGPLSSLAGAGVTWILLFANESSAAANLYDAVSAGLNVVVAASRPEGLSDLIRQAGDISAERLVVALHPREPVTPTQAQALVKAVRIELAALRLGECRVIVALDSVGAAASSFGGHSDIDGLLLLDAGFATAIELLRELVDA